MTFSTSPHAPPASGLGSRRVLALTVILSMQMLLQMDFLIVLVALPKIQADLGFSATTLSWVPNAFALALGGLLLLGGRLGDAFGRVRAFQFGIALVLTPGTVLTMDGVLAEHSGSASGLLQMDQQIRGALGTAVVTSVFAMTSIPGDFVSGLPRAFGVEACRRSALETSSGEEGTRQA